AGELLPPGHRINAYTHLMQRIDAKQIDALLAANRETLAASAETSVASDGAGGASGAAASAAQPGSARAEAAAAKPGDGPAPGGAGAPGALTIGIEDFQRVDLRIARVAHAEA